MSLPPWVDWRRPPTIHIPAPRCAICGRTVEKLTYWFSPDRGGYVVQAFCHGETEESVLPIALAAEGGVVVDAVAFKPQIEGPIG